ncbi:MAG: DUF1071 domain-containing protein [Bacilli bacterium]|nr:DUF1071 domain-containing protein [Bacilli bacterium]
MKTFNKMRNIDVSNYINKRDGADYINWAVVKQLLHDNGCEKVYFTPIQQENGSSLIMTDKVFTDNKGVTNQVYETRIKVTIDDLEFEIQGPVTNGANPVRDNSMTQQRLWNAQTRLFVKGVAIYTGLGFDLWSRIEQGEEAEVDDLSKHDIMKIKERCQEIYTQKLQLGLTTKEIADKLGKTEDDVKAIFTYFGILDDFEKKLKEITNDKK